MQNLSVTKIKLFLLHFGGFLCPDKNLRRYGMTVLIQEIIFMLTPTVKIVWKPDEGSQAR